MSRIGEQNRQAPVQTPKQTETVAPKAAPEAAAAPTATRAAGFSSASTFQAAGLSDGFGTAPSGAQRLTPNDLGVLAQNQGHTNACGTTSLANVMTHWGMPRTHEQIDKSIRPFDLFTAPDKLVSYARDHGMRAEIKTDAKLEDLAHMVDQGVPPIVLMDPDQDNNANLHYITVTGYDRDESGKISDVALADSAGGYRYTMPAAEFQQRWDNLKMQNIGTGLNNVMITTVPADGRKITGGDGLVRRAADIELPQSSFMSNLKSGLARGVSNVIADGAGVAEKTGHAAHAVGGFLKKLVD